MCTLRLGQRWCVFRRAYLFIFGWDLLASNCLPPTALLLPLKRTNTLRDTLRFFFWSPSPFGLFVLLSSTFPPFTIPSPPHLCCLHLHFLASLPSHPFWSVRQLEIQFFSLFFFFFEQIRGNQKLRNGGSSSITAVNHKPALPGVVWCREWFRFGSTQTALTYMHKPIWRCIVESVHLHKLSLWGRGSERLSTQTKWEQSTS